MAAVDNERHFPVPMDPSAYEFFMCCNVLPKLEYKNKKVQEKGDRGYPLWIVVVETVLKRTGQDYKFHVKIESEHTPAIKKLSLLEFENLTATPYTIMGENGRIQRQGTTITADSVKMTRRQQ